MACGARFAIDSLGSLTLVNLAFDDTFADLHQQSIDGRIVGERQRVDRLGVARAGVPEALGDAHACDDAGHRDAQVGLERRRGRVAAVGSLKQQALARRRSLGNSAARAAWAFSVA